MKLSGIIVMLIGVVGLLFFGLISLQADQPGAPVSASPARQDVPIPLVMGVAAILAGAAMLVFGGRGYVVLPKSQPIKNEML